MIDSTLCWIIPRSTPSLIALCAIESLWSREKLGLVALCAIKLEETLLLGDLASIQLYKVQQNTLCGLVSG